MFKRARDTACLIRPLTHTHTHTRIPQEWRRVKLRQKATLDFSTFETRPPCLDHRGGFAHTRVSVRHGRHQEHAPQQAAGLERAVHRAQGRQWLSTCKETTTKRGCRSPAGQIARPGLEPRSCHGIMRMRIKMPQRTATASITQRTVQRATQAPQQQYGA